MEHLLDLLETYPNTMITRPSCGASSASFVLRMFGKDVGNISLLDESLGTDIGSRECSMQSLVFQLESNGLSVLPMNASLEELKHYYESYISIISTTEEDANSDLTRPNHFQVLIAML